MAANPTIKFVRSVSPVLSPEDSSLEAIPTNPAKNIRSGNLSEQTPAWSLGKFCLAGPDGIHTTGRDMNFTSAEHMFYVQTLGWCKSQLRKEIMFLGFRLCTTFWCWQSHTENPI